MSSWIYQIVRGQLPFLDKWTQPFAEELSGTLFYTFSREITILGSYPVIYSVTIAGIVLLFILYRTWIEGITYGLGVMGTHLLNRIIKELVGRERPLVLAEINASGESFPSAHAMSSLVCYGFLAYFIGNKIYSKSKRTLLQIIAALLVIIVGMSRYVTNVHFLSDVLAGFIIGLICLVGLIYLYRKLKEKSKNRIPSRSLD